MKCDISVKVQGDAPNRAYQAHLQIGGQGFDIEPLYFEDGDEDAKGSAEWMVSMLCKAFTSLGVSVNRITEGG